jgi:DNA (cytosine-5)-methyltransferase 1
MSNPTIGELCAGYGGLSLAVEEVFNATTAWFSEYDAAPSKILAHHWPDVPNHGDMTKIDWAAIEPVDIISGGTPCQDLSAAGRRAGMNEGTRSNLWVQMREAIAIQKPKYVVWENVRGAYSATASSDLEQCSGCMGDATDRGTVLRALGRVLGDLSDLGFDTEWRGLRAADVGACHGRFRVFILAGRRNVADTKRLRGQRRGITGDLAGAPGTGEANGGEWERDGNAADDSHSVDWGDYEPAIRRWERTIGRAAPRPTEPTGRNNGHRLSPRFTEWMMGLPDGWVTYPAIGISRNEQLKACGNGVVPQQAMAALRDMLAAFQTAEVAA